jgi:hypothetical protein
LLSGSVVNDDTQTLSITTFGFVKPPSGRWTLFEQAAWAFELVIELRQYGRHVGSVILLVLENALMLDTFRSMYIGSPVIC